MTATTTLTCNFPGCETKDLKPETAMVPSIKAIRQAEGGKVVTPLMLAPHVLCADHAALGRGMGGGMFSYVETVQQLERREADRGKAPAYFARYMPAVEPPKTKPGKPQAQPAPSKTAMQIAFERGGLAPGAKPNGKATHQPVQGKAVEAVPATA
jgi:hypothetical protein